MPNRYLKVLLMLVVYSSIVSCAMGPSELESLDSSVRAYERAVRWGDFTAAKSFHKASPELDGLERRRLKLYRVTGYNVISSEIPNLTNAYNVVEIKYYKNDRPVIKTLSLKQHWKRDKGSKLWYLVSSFPNFR